MSTTNRIFDLVRPWNSFTIHLCLLCGTILYFAVNTNQESIQIRDCLIQSQHFKRHQLVCIKFPEEKTPWLASKFNREAKHPRRDRNKYECFDTTDGRLSLHIASWKLSAGDKRSNQVETCRRYSLAGETHGSVLIVIAT